MFKHKPLLTVLAGCVACIVLVGAVVAGAIGLTHTQSASLGHARAVCQRYVHPVHAVIFSDASVSPKSINAKRCDRATFTNTGTQAILVAFGPHEQHQSYDGISEYLLYPGKQLSITLIRSGTLHFHDHDNDTLQGNFYIK